MKKRWWLIVSIAPLVIAAAAVLVFVVFNQKPRTQTYANTEHGISLVYPENIVSQNISDEDKKNNRILRLNREEPATRIIVWYENGLKIGTSLTKQQPLDRILDALPKVYPKQFPEFHQLEERRIKIGTKEAAEVIFTYKGTTGALVREQLLIVIKDADKAIYIAAHVAEDQYNTLSKELDSLFSSVRVN